VVRGQNKFLLEVQEWKRLGTRHPCSRVTLQSTF